MTKKLNLIFSFFLLAAAVLWSFYGKMPQKIKKSVPKTEFSTIRAFEHVKALARQPHYVGSKAHSRTRNYIVSQLQKMGLLVQTQEGYSLNKYGIIARPQNILTRIDGSGSGKALLLLSHYDSAVHSSYGASDAGSGIATILEGIRAFLASGTKPTNDI
ncbi:MAG TPA: M28 family peptidase, partial [Salinimicrobium sp.]|nr:M28 family peptidase [Salinimicrobium sp.]